MTNLRLGTDPHADVRADLDVEAGTLRDAYADRLYAADPLLPEPAELSAGADLLVARVGDSVAAGSGKFDELDPGSLNATWGALRQHTMRIQVAGPDPAAALDALLDRWQERVAGAVTPGDREHAAVVNWPSRDTEPLRALAAHGFAPAVTMAVRTATRDHGGPATEGLTVRPLRGEDVDTVMPLYLQVIDFDRRFGMVTARPTTADRLRELLTEVTGRNTTCAWIAERDEQDGAPVGLCYLDTPDHAQWIQSAIRLAPVAYLGCLVVDQNARGTGVGTALATQAHRAATEAGAAGILLHHAVPNPLSTPFWYRHGYRPLWTTWQRRPALSA